MNFKEINWVLKNIVDQNICSKNTQWYIFGSILRNNPFISDIDLLVIYTHVTEVQDIRKKISPLEFERPLDIIFMTKEEENELNFIKSESCKEIFPMNTIII